MQTHFIDNIGGRRPIKYDDAENRLQDFRV